MYSKIRLFKLTVLTQTGKVLKSQVVQTQTMLTQTGKILKCRAVQTQTVLTQTGKVLKNQAVQTPTVLTQTGKVLKNQAVQTPTVLTQTGKVLKNQAVQTRTQSVLRSWQPTTGFVVVLIQMRMKHAEGLYSFQTRRPSLCFDDNDCSRCVQTGRPDGAAWRRTGHHRVHRLWGSLYSGPEDSCGDVHPDFPLLRWLVWQDSGLCVCVWGGGGWR